MKLFFRDNDLKRNPYRIPPQRLFWVITGLSFTFQLILITYNHISGIFINQSTGQFLLRWIFSSVLTMAGFALIIFPDLWLIRYLNAHFAWGRHVLHRILPELTGAVIIAFIVSTLITAVSHFINSYPDGLMPNVVNNGLITSVVNLLIMAGLEGWIFYRESRISQEKAEELERELTGIRFEVLKNQINPHFLFNSLNVLSGLVGKDTRKAQEFIDEFSMIYRYVLETIEKRVTLLKDELEFARSYMFLQQIRYGECLNYRVELSSHHLHHHLPPLSLQVVLENAIKHNIINDDHPLRITIRSEGDHLIVQNNMQQKLSSRQDTGIGQQNLIKRYRLIGDQEPEFRIINQDYLVKLPLFEQL